MPARLRNPSISINDYTITFPVDVETGQFLEFHAPDDCVLYGPKGEKLRDVTPAGDVPTLEPGPNQVRFAWEATEDVHPRAHVSLITEGKPFGE